MTERPHACPSAHCERAAECRSPHECAANPEIFAKKWADVYWHYCRKGHDQSDAAFRADEWEKRHTNVDGNIVMDDEIIDRIKLRRYECFMEDHETLPWTPGRCAGFAGRGSRALHLFRCKRKDGHGVGGLFCSQHARDFEDRQL